MNVFRSIAAFRAWRRGLPPGVVIPFVPTMGALHQGHLSLVEHAQAVARQYPAGLRLASIFVNPTQFGPTEDFARYPRTEVADLALLEKAGCDAVFMPPVSEMYPPGEAAVTVDPGPLGDILEGAARPGHFCGVCTVVAKLLNIVEPTHLLLGQKDYQQQLLLRRMCADLNFSVEVMTCPTVREPDGLAMSSRNRYLTPEERPNAAGLYAALQTAGRSFAAGERRAPVLEAELRQRLEAARLHVQYAVARRAHNLAPWAGPIDGPCVLLAAVTLGATRLIDNVVL